MSSRWGSEHGFQQADAWLIEGRIGFGSAPALPDRIVVLQVRFLAFLSGMNTIGSPLDSIRRV